MYKFYHVGCPGSPTDTRRVDRIDPGSSSGQSGGSRGTTSHSLRVTLSRIRGDTAGMGIPPRRAGRPGSDRAGGRQRSRPRACVGQEAAPFRGRSDHDRIPDGRRRQVPVRDQLLECSIRADMVQPLAPTLDATVAFQNDLRFSGRGCNSRRLH
jgi:hypothetical protein